MMKSQTNPATSPTPPTPVQVCPVDRTLAASASLVVGGGVVASQNAQQITKMCAKL
jgi:heptaprenylglyceryl phosphate synthase